MAEFEVETKYPCGYELKVRVKVNPIFLDEGQVLTRESECPLHGKNCKRGIDIEISNENFARIMAKLDKFKNNKRSK